MNEQILNIENLSIAFNKNYIFENVSFRVNKGDFIGLKGSNGSGKTTLFKIVSGEIVQTAGSVIYKNQNIDLLPITSRIQKGIIYLHQFPIVYPDLFAWENFAIWCSINNDFCNFNLSKERIITYLDEKLFEIGLQISLEKKVSDLTEIELQILEFTRCFIADAKLILVDETTSVLDKNVSNKIITYLKQFCLNGGAVIFISHRIKELESYSNYIFEIKNKRISLFDKKNASNENVISNRINNDFKGKRTILDLTINFTKIDRPLKINLLESEIIGVSGLDGSNFEHFSSVIYRSIENEKYKIGKDFSFLGKNRQTDWIFPNQTLQFNLCLTKHKNIFIKTKGEKINELIQYYQIEPPIKNKIINEFSGGNKLKTALGRTLLSRCNISILDEPFTGIDTKSRAGIISIINDETTLNKTAFIILSKEYEELIKFCHKIIIFKNNGDFKILDNNDIFAIDLKNAEYELFN